MEASAPWRALWVPRQGPKGRWQAARRSQPQHAQPQWPSRPSKTTPKHETRLERTRSSVSFISSFVAVEGPFPRAPSARPLVACPACAASNLRPIDTRPSPAMRERVTFVHPQDAELDPTALSIQQAGLLGPSIESTREDRLTIPLDELPLELAGLLQAYRELHLRWSSPLAYDTLEPFSSRLSPGLHVLFTPSKNGAHDSSVLPPI